jgi:hypothetical protein
MKLAIPGPEKPAKKETTTAVAGKKTQTEVLETTLSTHGLVQAIAPENQRIPTPKTTKPQ